MTALDTTKFATLAPVGSSIRRAPSYVKHREAVSVADSAAPTSKLSGLNANGFKKAHVQVVPSTTAVVDVEVLYWSEAAAKFISSEPKLVKSIEADTPVEFTFDVLGRIFWVKIAAITGLAATVDVAAAVSDLDEG